MKPMKFGKAAGKPKADTPVAVPKTKPMPPPVIPKSGKEH